MRSCGGQQWHWGSSVLKQLSAWGLRCEEGVWAQPGQEKGSGSRGTRTPTHTYTHTHAHMHTLPQEHIIRVQCPAGREGGRESSVCVCVWVRETALRFCECALGPRVYVSVST